MSRNNWLGCLFSLATLGGSAFAQAPAPIAAPPGNVAPIPNAVSYTLPNEEAPALNLNDSPMSNRLRGNQNFQNFIGFISNPLQNIDPRAVTELYPLFMSYHVSSLPALPSTSMQLYGAGITVALSERLSIGLNQGGWAQATFSRNQPGLFPNLQGILQDRSKYGGLREGWLDLGGFIQYTVIENVPDQFLLTAGLRWAAPSGASQLFQGDPPWQLAPYVTAGKELGKFHVLATTGFNFSAGSGPDTVNNLYVNLHLDRQCFGWLYPLVEVSSSYPTKNFDVSLPTRRGYIDFGSFSTTGTVVMLAAGANAVIVPNKVEFGAVYTTSIYTQRNFDVNGLIVRMTLRY